MRFLLLAVLAAIAIPVMAQRTARPPGIISSLHALDSSVAARPGSALVSLPQFIPGIVLDIRYATPHNFTGKSQYTQDAAWLRLHPAQALRQVQEALHKKGLSLKIYDAYRPYSVTCALWAATAQKRYVANPRRGSHHNRATAVDLTIIDLKTGRELDMGTGFDNFTDSAHHSFTALPPQVLANRRLLRSLMWQNGFTYVPTEWWHYHWRVKDFPLLDIPFEQLHP